jgi:cytochrome c oxidase cbb3-type subunit III
MTTGVSGADALGARDHAPPAATDDGEARLVGHEYDGIREYDNPLPFWWSAIFILTIGFAFVYPLWFHRGEHTAQAQLADDLRAREETMAAAAKRTGLVVTEEVLTAWATDPDVMADGRRVFATNCVGCHGPAGAGLTGPNLTDGHQLHGSTRLDLYQIARDGVVSKGMLAWGQILPATDVAHVAAYVATLRATFAPGGKHAEGAKVGAWR